MNKLLDDYLCKKYPKIFVDRNKPMSQTSMCWGFPGNGWCNIIDALCETIQHRIDNPPYQEAKTIRNWLGKLWNKLVWYPIVHSISRKFPCHIKYFDYFYYQIRYIPDPIPQVVAHQVKEKFGGLRFYISGGDDLIWGMVKMAESLSYHVCEKCGIFNESVSQNTKGWMKTTCVKCTDASNRTSHKKNQNQELIKIFKTVRKEPPLTKAQELKKVIQTIAEVKNYK